MEEHRKTKEYISRTAEQARKTNLKEERIVFNSARPLSTEETLLSKVENFADRPKENSRKHLKGCENPTRGSRECFNLIEYHRLRQ